MEKSLRNSICTIVISLILIFGITPNIYAIDKKELQANIKKSLVKLYPNCKPIAKVISKKSSFTGKTVQLDKLSIKLNNVSLGNIQADFFTIIFNNAKIDLRTLNKKALKIISYNKMKLKIGVSPAKMEKSMQIKMKGLGKSKIKTDFKFSPPYVECFYNVPESQLGNETKGMLVKYISGSNIEGYMAFKLGVKSNNLYAYPSKVIMNHFLLPSPLINNFNDVYNPFETIWVIKPFKYKINKVEVQDKYIIFSN